jgi:nucleoside-diphosphate-sugar epimerase
MMSAKSALITGATGFIGNYLAKRLVSDGWDVHAVLRSSSDIRCLQPIIDGIVIHRHDGSTANLCDILALSKPKVVFHLASLFLSQHSTEDIERLIKSNILFSTQLAEAMVNARCFRLINTGTSWQHSEIEDHCPVNLYAATKQAFEEILIFYTTSYPLKACSLHLFDTYGPNDHRPKLFKLLKRAAVSGERLEMSPGEQLIDLVYIDDVIDAFLAAEQSLDKQIIPHKIYSVSSGAPVRLRDLISIFERTTNLQLNIVWGGRPYRNREVMKPWCTGDLVPGWTAKVTLEEGIRRLMAHDKLI